MTRVVVKEVVWVVDSPRKVVKAEPRDAEDSGHAAGLLQAVPHEHEEDSANDQCLQNEEECAQENEHEQERTIEEEHVHVKPALDRKAAMQELALLEAELLQSQFCHRECYAS